MFSICLVSFITPAPTAWSALALAVNLLMATAMALFKPMR